MPIVKYADDPSGVFHDLVLASTILLLAVATFDSPAIASMTYILRYVAAGLLLISTWSQGQGAASRLRHCPRPARALILSSWGLSLLAAISVAWSVDPIETLLQAAVYALLVGNMHVHVTHRWLRPQTVIRDVRTIFWTLAITVVVSLASGASVGTRLGGIYANPNMLGIICAFTIALGTGLLASRVTTPVLITSALAVVALIASESRTALISIAAGLIWIVIRRRPNAWFVASMCLCGAIGVFCSLVSVRIPLPAVAGRFAAHGDLFNSRTQAWWYALELWERQPLTGYGFRVGEVIFAQFRYETTFLSDGAHNSYLQLLLELGILGMAPFAVILVTLVVVLARYRPIGVGMGLGALVIAGLATGYTESAMFGVGQPVSWVFWLLAAALASVSQDTPQSHENVVPTPARRPTRSNVNFVR